MYILLSAEFLRAAGQNSQLRLHVVNCPGSLHAAGHPNAAYTTMARLIPLHVKFMANGRCMPSMLSP